MSIIKTFTRLSFLAACIFLSFTFAGCSQSKFDDSTDTATGSTTTDTSTATQVQDNALNVDITATSSGTDTDADTATTSETSTAATESTATATATSTQTSKYAKIYVSIVMHCEEPNNKPSNPDFTKNEDRFDTSRAAVLDLANMLKGLNVKFNYQSDWNFLLAMTMFDEGSDTGGKNLVKYMVEDLGFEVDPHAHETKYSYADVAYLNGMLGITPSKVAGGMVYLPVEDSKFDYLLAPVLGKIYDTSWQAEILWGASTAGHSSDDEQASGVWRPASASDFFTDDPSHPIYVGGYTRDADGIINLINLAEAGTLDPSLFYTAAYMTNQGKMEVSGEIDAIRADIEKIMQRDTNGLVQWVGLTEAVKIWQSEYNSQSNILQAE